MDQFGTASLARVRADDLRALFAAILRRRLPGAARRIVGGGVVHSAPQLPQLGSSLPSPDFLWRPAGLGRQGTQLMCRHLGWLGARVSVSSLVLDPPQGLR